MHSLKLCVQLHWGLEGSGRLWNRPWPLKSGISKRRKPCCVPGIEFESRNQIPIHHHHQHFKTWILETPGCWPTLTARERSSPKVPRVSLRHNWNLGTVKIQELPPFNTTRTRERIHNIYKQPQSTEKSDNLGVSG